MACSRIDPRERPATARARSNGPYNSVFAVVPPGRNAGSPRGGLRRPRPRDPRRRPGPCRRRFRQPPRPLTRQTAERMKSRWRISSASLRPGSRSAWQAWRTSGAIAFLCSEMPAISASVDLRGRGPEAFAPRRLKRASPEGLARHRRRQGSAPRLRRLPPGGAVVVADLDGRGGTRRRGEASSAAGLACDVSDEARAPSASSSRAKRRAHRAQCCPARMTTLLDPYYAPSMRGRRGDARLLLRRRGLRPPVARPAGLEFVRGRDEPRAFFVARGKQPHRLVVASAVAGSLCFVEGIAGIEGTGDACVPRQCDDRWRGRISRYFALMTETPGPTSSL